MSKRPPNQTNDQPRKSKAALTVELQNINRAVSSGIKQLHAHAQNVLYRPLPTKCQRQLLVDAAPSLLSLQGTVKTKIPKLVPDDCTRYLLNRMQV